MHTSSRNLSAQLLERMLDFHWCPTMISMRQRLDVVWPLLAIAHSFHQQLKNSVKEKDEEKNDGGVSIIFLYLTVQLFIISYNEKSNFSWLAFLEKRNFAFLAYRGFVCQNHRFLTENKLGYILRLFDAITRLLRMRVETKKDVSRILTFSSYLIILLTGEILLEKMNGIVGLMNA